MRQPVMEWDLEKPLTKMVRSCMPGMAEKAVWGSLP